MGETLTKKQWQEKKHSRFERKRRAAVSAQTARIIDKLLERSQGLSNSSYEHRTNAITASRHFKGPKDGRNEAVLTDSVTNYNLGTDSDTLAISTSERQVKPLIGKEHGVKTAHITQSSVHDMVGHQESSRYLNLDSEGKRRPEEVSVYGYGRDNRFKSHLSSKEVVRRAAPALYEMKKAIDEAEVAQKHKAA